MGWEFVVKKKPFSVEQIVTMLTQTELGLSVGDASRQMDVSKRAIYCCKRSMESRVRSGTNVKQLQDENVRLKRLVAV